MQWGNTKTTHGRCMMLHFGNRQLPTKTGNRRTSVPHCGQWPLIRQHHNHTVLLESASIINKTNSYRAIKGESNTPYQRKSATCKYRHQCSHCEKNHPEMDCSSLMWYRPYTPKSHSSQDGDTNPARSNAKSFRPTAQASKGSDRPWTAKQHSITPPYTITTISYWFGHYF